MAENIGQKEVTYTFPVPTGGWEKVKILTAKGFRLLKSIHRHGMKYSVIFSAATRYNEWFYEILDEGSCSWLHDMGPRLCANAYRMPTVSQVVQWERPLAEDVSSNLVSSFGDPYGLSKQSRYWPAGNHPSGPIKRG